MSNVLADAILLIFIKKPARQRKKWKILGIEIVLPLTCICKKIIDASQRKKRCLNTRIVKSNYCFTLAIKIWQMGPDFCFPEIVSKTRID